MYGGRTGEREAVVVVTREVIGPRHRRAPTPSEVRLLAHIAFLLDGGATSGGLDAALLLLRDAVRADAGEVFLVASKLREMALVSHHGPDPEAFLERSRFGVGEGFPGLVLDTGAGFATRDLSSDDEFVRIRVKDAGYGGAACMPIRSGRNLRGCLLLAWKEPPAEWHAHVRAPIWASVLLASALDGVHCARHGRNWKVARRRVGAVG